MIELHSIRDIKKEHAGMFARFRGRGIMDGFVGEPTKFECHEILGVGGDRVNVRSYRRRTTSYVPYHTDQEVRLYSKAEYKKMNVYE